jgi:hypothetical protein
MTYDTFKEMLEEKLDDIYEFIKGNCYPDDDTILNDIDALREDALDAAESIEAGDEDDEDSDEDEF